MVPEASTHFTQGIGLYAPSLYRSSKVRDWGDSGVTCHSYAALTLWLLGYPDQGWTQIDKAVTLAQQRAHPFSLNIVLDVAAMFSQFRREGGAARECAEAAITLAQE